MKRFRLSTLLLVVVIAALVAALIVQSRRIAELEAAAAPTLKSWRMVAEKRGAELQIERTNRMKSIEGKNR
jgi:hypothetical protein